MIADKLTKNKEQKLHIARITFQILAKIDDELKEAHESGRKSISTTAPITFSIPYMKNKDAQREIYHSILMSLVKRKFHPKMEFKKESTVFHISWLSEKELKEIDAQNNALAKYTT